MERFSKIGVTLWTCAAVLLQAWLLRSWSDLPWLTLVIGVAMVLLAWIDRRAIAMPFAVAYVFPVLVWYVHGTHYVGYAVLWLAALLGAIVPDALRKPWHLPPVWRAALVFSALVVVASATLSIWRETQGAPAVVLELGPPLWEGPVQPSFPVRWILNVSLILLVGILFFDWLLGIPGFDVDRAVWTPLLASSVVMSSASVYQMFVDMQFLNPGIYGHLSRATGTMFDGNVAGMIAAMWTGGALLWAQRGPAWRHWLAPIVILINGLGAWASGSRTAVVAVLVIGVLSTIAFLGRGRLQIRRIATVAALMLVLLAIVVTVGRSDRWGTSAGHRLWRTIAVNPSADVLVDLLWRRDGYGSAALLLLRESPLVGVGAGSFHGFVGDVGPQVGVPVLPPDNAQNWLRHQLTEFGVLGGIGWLVWYVAFAWFVLRPRRGQPPEAWIARGILVAFGAMSWLGMPGQDAMVAITFWAMAFWYVHIVGWPSVWTPLPTWLWRAMAVVVIVFSAITIRVSATTWSVAERARLYDRPFTFGMSRPQPSGPDAGYRRALSRATALVTPHSRWLVVRVKRAPDALEAGPVDVLVTSDRRTVLKARLDASAVAEGFVPVKPEDRHMLFEMTARPPGPFTRLQPFAVDSGVLVSWSFVEYVSGDVKQYSALRDGERR